MDATAARRLPVGAEVMSGGGVHFRVWAPRARSVEVVIGDATDPGAFPMTRDARGYHEALVATARDGTRYRYRLDGGDAYPDPVSRFQPEGPLGPSQVVDPSMFPWTDDDWRGRALRGQVIYELHVGTFTPEGSWEAARAQLAELAALGVTVIEVMPVAEFPGRFNWGYDGVDLFAPAHVYGAPDDFRRFVNEAHANGLAVILDVVYNHVGPDGNFLDRFSAEYFSSAHHTDWGDAVNFDGPGCREVREFFLSNVEHWIREYHLDGLRLDATQNIYDDSSPHILQQIGERVRLCAKGRATIVVNENEPQHARLVREPAQGGLGLDGIWNDDWHHAATVALTARDEAYYTDYTGSARELAAAAKYGFLYQGQWYRWQGKRRGAPALDLEPWRLVHFLQNHDQIANSGLGDRVHRLASPGRMRAMTALLLLGPQTPMLFQGQEFAASAPFLYFADHAPDLARRVAEGRATELSQFPSLALKDMRERLSPPHDERTFLRCKLDFSERERNREAYDLHRDLLRLRREEVWLSSAERGSYDAAALGEQALLVRWFTADGRDRLLLVNLARTLHLDPAPEPLLAPPEGMRWRVRWSSEDPRYGGLGTPEPDAAEANRDIPGKAGERRPRENWRIPGESAVLLTPTEA